MENYIVSARKYRPSTFQSVVGQKALTQTLKNAIVFGDFVVSVFSSQRAMQVMCLVQFSLNAIMCLAIMLHYNKMVAAEQVEHTKAQKSLYSARRIYNTDCVGIDTLDDDFSL